MENIRGLAYFCMGCAVGAVAAAVCTPKSGPETVNYLRKRAEEGTEAIKATGEYVKQRVDDVSGAVAQTAKTTKRTVRNHVDAIGDAVEAGRDAYQNSQTTTV